MESKIYPVEHSYFEIKRLISTLIARYPFVNLSHIGRSAAGRDIPALTIGSGSEYTAFVSGDDPLCRITTLILLRFVEELCDNILNGNEMCGLNIRKAMFGRGVIVVPQLNPDGAEIALRGEMGCGYMAGKISRLCGGDFSVWRANLRGVEIARNLPFAFEARKAEEREAKISGPKPYGFSGYRPESEPETLALTELCRTRGIRQMSSLSAFGQTVSYSGADTVPDRSVKMAEVMAAVSSFAVQPPIAKGSVELNDWFAYEFSRPGLCLRVGTDSVPTASELVFWYKRVREALTLAALF